MTLTPDAVRALLQSGESETVEFKAALRDPSTLARLIAAFANSKGGTILVGVGDHGEILGADLEEISRVFHAALSRLHRPPKVDLDGATLDGKQIGVITIGKGNTLVLVEGGAFARVASHVEVMSAPAIARVLRPDLPDDSANVAEGLHNLTVMVEALRAEIEHGNTFRGQLKNYLVGGLIGAALGALLTGLLGL